MTLKQSNYKSITALLLILVIAVGAVWAPLYVEASHGHDCSGTSCPVCLTVSVIGSCLNYVLPALLPLLLSLSVPAEKCWKQGFACQSGKADADRAESAS